MQQTCPDNWTAPPAFSETVVRALRHEVGDLLQSIYATVAIVQQRLPQGFDQERQILADLRVRGDACKELLDQAQDLIGPLSLIHVPAVKPVDVIVPLLAEVRARYPRLRVTGELDRSLTLQADLRRLRTAIGSILVLACEASQEKVALRVAAPNQGTGVEILVDHDGTGQPATGPESTESSLLRMHWWLAGKIARAHGGRLSASQHPPQGWRFLMFIPAEPLGAAKAE
jgi:signal transduction histidine kinase